jgi:hypothetical protein
VKKHHLRGMNIQPVVDCTPHRPSAQMHSPTSASSTLAAYLEENTRRSW